MLFEGQRRKIEGETCEMSVTEAFHAFLDDWDIRLRPRELMELSWFLTPREEPLASS